MTGRSLGSVTERRARLARRHLLAAPARAETAAEVAAALIALHGTDPRDHPVISATRARC